MRSALYRGTLEHTRVQPHVHRFEYGVFMVYAHLDEVEALCAKSFLWTTRVKGWFAAFYRKDFHGNPEQPLAEAVKQTVYERTGKCIDGDIYMLANWRYFGFNMNPLVTYYCFNQGDTHPRAILAEVTNTPWRERHAYVLDCDPKTAMQKHQFDKKMHVSPFNGMDSQYRWSSDTPGQSLRITLENLRDGRPYFNAQLKLDRVPISAKSLAKILVQYPWMSLKAGAAIYWEALKLWLKRVPVYNHPEKVVKTQDHL